MKPHIKFFSQKGMWVCFMKNAKSQYGEGYSVLEAYNDWLLHNR